MGKHDFVSVVVRPERLQPFYLMPVSFASKLILTMLIFGFGLSFQEIPPERFPCERAVKRVVQQIAGCGMIAMALHGYYVDGKKISLACQQLELSSQRWAVALITCLTSANYIAARAVWGSLVTENPTNLLKLEPRKDVALNIVIPTINVPLFPGVVSWLPCFKHVYALLLLPYFVPYMMASFGLGCFVWVWCCSTKCVVCIGMCVAGCRTCAAFFGVIFTLFLWPWPRKCFLYWWGVYWPVCYAGGIQFWATFITPIFFSFVFGALACVSFKSIVQGIARGVNGNMTLAEENITQLVAWNAEKLKPDFVLPETSPAQSASAEEVADVETPVGETPDEEILVANPEEKTQMWVKPKSPSFLSRCPRWPPSSWSRWSPSLSCEPCSPQTTWDTWAVCSGRSRNGRGSSIPVRCMPLRCQPLTKFSTQSGCLSDFPEFQYHGLHVVFHACAWASRRRAPWSA